MGRGDRDGVVMAVENPRRGPEKTRLLHRPRPEPIADRVLGDAVRNAEFRRAWRVLLGQYGGGRHVHDRRELLGIWRTRLGKHTAVSYVLRLPGPRFETDQAGPVRAAAGRGPGPFGQTRM